MEWIIYHDLIIFYHFEVVTWSILAYVYGQRFDIVSVSLLPHTDTLFMCVFDLTKYYAT